MELLNKRLLSALRRRPLRRRERGSSLTGYALVVATLVAVSLVGIESLNDNSEDFLVNTGSQVGSAREYSDIAVNAPLGAPPAWATPTVPPTLRTYTDAQLNTAGGCIGFDGATSALIAAACTDLAVITVTAASNNGTDVELSFAGGCFGANPGGSPEIFATGCGSSPWTQIDTVLPEVRYEYNGTGQCIGFLAGNTELVLQPCGDSSTNINIV